MARDTFTPALLAAIAGGRSSLATSCGTTACQAGTVERPGGADQEGEQQEIARCRQTQTDNRGINRRDRGRQQFNDEQEFPLVENVGERAGGNREQENRQRARRLHQSDDQRIGIEAGHQPARCGAVHPPADIGDQRRRPDDGKGGTAKRRPKRRRPIRSALGGAHAAGAGADASAPSGASGVPRSRSRRQIHGRKRPQRRRPPLRSRD